MNRNVVIAAALLLISITALAGETKNGRDQSTGNFSIGTRNTISMFNDDAAIGKGIGGQFRFQFMDKLNSEWYADYIPSQTKITHRDDYHIGWSLMYYFGKNVRFDHVLQPYLIAGHCFDYSVVSQVGNHKNNADRFSSATQAGLGTHFNITKRFDCSLSAQYMLHFGKEIETDVVNGDGKLDIHRSEFVKPDGHLLFTISFNYKFVNFLNGWKG
ncbi:MAG: hypothetical protein NTV09_02720 [Bacteroidetes bacterium]|nr:hypothetical protein [Bacteroidota bacterium]